MAQTGRSNVRHVDPQRRYTVVLSPSWNAPFGALPHDDRAGTHDSADGRCGSYVSIGCGQAALWITSKKFCGFAALRDFEAAFDRSGSAGGRDAKRARSRHAAWVLHVIRFGLDALPANPRNRRAIIIGESIATHLKLLEAMGSIIERFGHATMVRPLGEGVQTISDYDFH